MDPSPVQYSALCITHDCNLRCRYCYAGEKSKKSMSPDTARRAIDFLASSSNAPCTITFFGGEPLMKMDLIKEIVEYSERTYGEKLRFRMSTNGTLLKPSIIDYCRDHDLYFVLSLDGHEKQHDTNRRFAGGSGSYRTIAGRLPEILDFNPYTLAVSVVTPDTTRYLAQGVKSLFRQGFRYVVQTLDYSAGWDKPDIARLKKEYSLLAAYYFERLCEGTKIYYGPFDERIKTRAQKPYGKGDLCDLANTQIAIAASGRIYPCVQFIGEDSPGDHAHVIGDVFDGFDGRERQYYIEENHGERESCRGCALHGRCATYCGCVNWRATGDLKTVPPIICEHERMLMPIVDRLANRLWKRNVALFRRKFYERTYPVSSYIEDCALKEGS